VIEEGSDFTADNVDSFEQNKTKSNVENVDEHVSKRPKETKEQEIFYFKEHIKYATKCTQDTTCCKIF